MTRQQIFNSVANIIHHQMGAPIEDITEQTTFWEDVGMDSLDQVEMIMECEDEFDISIPDDDADKLLNVKQVVDYLFSRVGNEESQAA